MELQINATTGAACPSSTLRPWSWCSPAAYCEAETRYRGAHEALLVGRPPGHPQIAGASDALIAVLLAQDTYAAAEPLPLAAHGELETQGDPAARAAATRLVELYERWAVADPAADLSDRAASWRAQSQAPDAR